MATSKLRQAYADADEPLHQVRLAVVAAHLGDTELIEQICAEHAQPQRRTVLVHLLPKFHGELMEIQQFLRDEDSDHLKYVLCLSLCLFDSTLASPVERSQMVGTLSALQQTTTDSGVRAAAEVALRNWAVGGVAALNMEPTTTRIDANWQDCFSGLRLVKIPAGTHLLGRIDPNVLHDGHLPHLVTLTKDYWIADREVSIGLYQEFLDDDEYSPVDKPILDCRRPPDPETSPTSAHPVQRVSWNDAAMFCNWLSWRHGLRPRYLFTPADSEANPTADAEVSPRENSAVSQEWLVTIQESADGFRLPTLAEWEVACRAGATTDFFFGDNFELFEFYGRFSSARIKPTAACGTLLPNRYGLHETLGNVWEWCEDWYEPLGTESLVDPHGPTKPLKDYVGRTFAGGGVQTTSGEPIAGSRGFAPVDGRFGNLGFRVALPDRRDELPHVDAEF